MSEYVCVCGYRRGRAHRDVMNENEISPLGLKTDMDRHATTNILVHRQADIDR